MLNIHILPTHVVMGLVIETTFDYLLTKYNLPFSSILFCLKKYNKTEDDGFGEVHFATITFNHRLFDEIEVDIFIDLNKGLFGIHFNSNNGRSGKYTFSPEKLPECNRQFISCLEHLEKNYLNGKDQFMISA